MTNEHSAAERIAAHDPQVVTLEHLRTWAEDGYRLELFDTHRTDSDGKSILSYALHDEQYESDPEPVFIGADFHCSPLHAIDSDATVASLLGFLSLRPGDTDSEYFETYSPEQLNWAGARAEYLGLLAYDLEEKNG